MTITEIRKRRGRLYLLVLDGEPAMTVDIRTFEESPYRVGSSLSEEELRALLDESGRRRAEEKAVYLLSRGDHSRPNPAPRAEGPKTDDPNTPIYGRIEKK